MNFQLRDTGAIAFEIALIACLVSVLGICSMAYLGTTVDDAFQQARVDQPLSENGDEHRPNYPKYPPFAPGGQPERTTGASNQDF